MLPDGQKRNDGGWARGLREAAPQLGLGASLAASMVVPVLLGSAADRRFGWAPWGVLVGAFLGLAAVVWHLYKNTVGKRS